MAAPLRYQNQTPSATSNTVKSDCWNLGRPAFEWSESDSDKEQWQTRLSTPGAMLFTASDETTVQGFILAQPRTHPELNEERTFHISLAAISPEYRGQSIYPRLVEMVERHCIELGLPRLTICTYPKHSPRMYGLLRKNGWEEVCRRDTTSKGEKWGDQILFVREARERGK